MGRDTSKDFIQKYKMDLMNFEHIPEDFAFCIHKKCHFYVAENWSVGTSTTNCDRTLSFVFKMFLVVQSGTQIIIPRHFQEFSGRLSVVST